MLTYGQLYEGVLRKLDKFGSPDFDILDFNVFMGQAVRNVLTPALDAAETNPKTTDNIRLLIQRAVYKADAEEVANQVKDHTALLPVNYYHVRKRGVRVTYELLQAYGRHSKGELAVATATRVDGDQSAAARDNYFLRATHRAPHFRVVNDQIEVFPAATDFWKIIQIDAEYFKQPPVIRLDEDADGAPTAESAAAKSIFPDYLDDQFIEECVRLVQRSTGDERIPVNPGLTPTFLT